MVSAASQAYTVHRRSSAYIEQISFRLRNSNSRMARTILIDCEGLESEKNKHARPLEIAMRFGAVHSRGADVFFLILLWVEKKLFSKLVCTWRSNCS